MADESTIIREGNYILNIYDPPKDLKAGGILTGLNESQLSTLKTMLQELFSPLKDLKKEYRAVDDQKAEVVSMINALFNNRFDTLDKKLQVVREAHISGHDARPSNYFVCQDAGPTDVVKNPTFVITPGTISDPAGKTKRNAENLVQTVPSLRHEFIAQANLDNIIGSDITMSLEGESTYTIEVPISFGGSGVGAGAGVSAGSTLTGVFTQKTFKPVNPAAPFGGNPEKNKAILEFLQKKKDAPSYDTCKQLILAKELGDTLQVLWALQILTDKVKIKATEVSNSNTVITTNDTIVWLRCLVNKVPVIFSEPKGQAYLWNPGATSAANFDEMRKQFIKTIRTEVVTHNESVIEIIRRAKDSPRTGENWINGLTWTTASYEYAKEYLALLINGLTNINKDIDTYFSLVPTVDSAKELADRSHFLSPFKQKSDAYYSINSITFLLPSKFNFKARNFVPLKFAAGIPDASLFQRGGYRKQKGGVRVTEAQIRENITAHNINSLLDQAIAESQNPNPHVYGVRAALHLEPEGEYNLEYFSANVRPYLNTVDFFLYSYIRQFHPQLFTYANIVKEVLPEEIRIQYPQVTWDMNDTFPTTFFYNTDHTFILEHAIGDPTEAYSACLQVIALARALVDDYPTIATHDCRYFLSLFNRYRQELGRYAAPLVIELNQHGGGNSQSESFLDKAIDLYELYYSYRIRALYQDRMLNETDYLELKESLRIAEEEDSSLIPSTVELKKAANATGLAPQIQKAIPLRAQGGKRYRKTRKQKKSKASRTKRHRSTKRIRRS